MKITTKKRHKLKNVFEYFLFFEINANAITLKRGKIP